MYIAKQTEQGLQIVGQGDTLLAPHKALGYELMELPVDKDGNLFAHYNNDGTQNTKKAQEILAAKAAVDVKRKKQAQLLALKVTANTVAYDATGNAVGNMSAVVAVAGFKFNQMLASGTTPSDAYRHIYKEATIGWMGADNKVHNVQIESVCEALEKSMLEIAKIIGV